MNSKVKDIIERAMDRQYYSGLMWGTDDISRAIHKLMMHNASGTKEKIEDYHEDDIKAFNITFNRLKSLNRYMNHGMSFRKLLEKSEYRESIYIMQPQIHDMNNITNDITDAIYRDDQEIADRLYEDMHEIIKRIINLESLYREKIDMIHYNLYRKAIIFIFKNY